MACGGFTIADLLSTLSALGVVVSMGAVGFDAVASRFTLDNTTRTIAMTLDRARVTAIARGHVVNVTFGAQKFTATDMAVASGAGILAAGTVPGPLTVDVSGTASFSPLGTVAAPVTVTLHRNAETRVVRVSITGQVDVQ